MVVKPSKRFGMGNTKVDMKLSKENNHLQIATVTLNDVWAIRFK